MKTGQKCLFASCNNITKAPRYNYCSDECRQIDYTDECLNCGDIYQRHNMKTKYCSKYCGIQSRFDKEINEDGTKTCNGCKRELSTDCFTKYHGGVTDTRLFHARCKECMKDYKASKQDEGYYYWEIYKLTVEDVAAMLRKADFKCEICFEDFSPTKKFNIDHDHSCCKKDRTCGKCIRGVLCFACNTSIGRMKDSIENLRKAADYLEQYKNRV